ncbi:hypothetical protein SAMN05421805_10651 [Saccharopolyspora antimicrobica]|uniref:Flp pilus-assembly TadE/G-like n=1 Tax=Saccharopolyspora antimicrobica TaxID=455193 RepID=A0A1I5AYK7_9PSEU|nr:hypothetical protein [Saccharopolyspora antimicrobica]RKT86410.1 hypothetical protein ATL45_4777 [Saccharopolyspora antimicrobica]SFN67548.1 hypothetical protein SAMN05421805_10651 [Saccharopolyspora antimicrobica]
MKHPKDFSDAGSVSVLVAVLLPCLLLVCSLVADGADRLRALAQADAIAAEAARAALTALDTRGPTLTLDIRTATAAAQHYLTTFGHTGSVTVDGAATVRITVTHTEPARIRLLWDSHTVTGYATATLATSPDRGGSS